MALKRLRRLRFALVYPITALAVVVARTTEHSLNAGIALLVLGEAIRLWANGFVGHRKVNLAQRGQPKVGELITAGPYAYVRNPLYLGTLVIGIGFSLIVNSLWLMGLVVALFLVVYSRKIANEEATLARECGVDFERYRQEVPALLPTGRAASRQRGEWAWQGVAASKEARTVAWLIVAVIALYFWEEWVQEGELPLSIHRLKHVLLLSLAAALIAGDALFELRRRTMAPR
jgi:protein-S-isoprenylcysteine O-methyltransferase Ste14